MPRERGTCGICRRVRRLVVEPCTWSEQGYAWRCAECRELTGDDLASAKAEGEERVTARNLKNRLAYPVIGGPLDGEHALTSDFESGWRTKEPGMYHHLVGEYVEFNAASGGRRRIGGSPSMIFVHTSLLKPLKRRGDR